VLDRPIKAIGMHEVKVALHPEVRVTVKVNVARSPEEAELQAQGVDVMASMFEREEAGFTEQKSQTGEREGQFETNQQGQQQPGEDQSGAAPDEGMQGDTLSQQRTDVEGGSLAAGESDEIAGGFVGSKGERDSSSRLVDDEDEDFARDGQGAPEGK
jgi:hypothetical protein